MRAFPTFPGMLAEHDPPGELFVLRLTGFALEPARRPVGPFVATLDTRAHAANPSRGVRRQIPTGIPTLIASVSLLEG